MIMGQELIKIERMYDTVAKEYEEEYVNEHEKKPMDQEIFRRFSSEIGWPPHMFTVVAMEM